MIGFDSVPYALAMYLFSMSSFGLQKAYSSLGTQPVPGVVELLANLFGGPLSLIGIIALIVLGFMSFPWWLPAIALVFSWFFAGYTYGKLPIGAEYALFGFPAGVIATIIWVLI